MWKRLELSIRETDDLIRNAELCEPSSPGSEVALEKGILRLQLVYSNLRVIYLDIRKHWTAQDGDEFCKKHLITKVLELMNRVRENTLHLEDMIEAVRGVGKLLEHSQLYQGEEDVQNILFLKNIWIFSQV